VISPPADFSGLQSVRRAGGSASSPRAGAKLFQKTQNEPSQTQEQRGHGASLVNEADVSSCFSRRESKRSIDRAKTSMRSSCRGLARVPMTLRRSRMGIPFEGWARDMITGEIQCFKGLGGLAIWGQGHEAAQEMQAKMGG